MQKIVRWGGAGDGVQALTSLHFPFNHVLISSNSNTALTAQDLHPDVFGFAFRGFLSLWATASHLEESSVQSEVPCRQSGTSCTCPESELVSQPRWSRCCLSTGTDLLGAVKRASSP